MSRTPSLFTYGNPAALGPAASPAGTTAGAGAGGGIPLGKGFTLYQGIASTERAVNAYLDHHTAIRMAQGDQVGLAHADIQFRNQLASAAPVAGPIGKLIRRIDPFNEEASEEDVQRALQDAQQGGQKATMMQRQADFRRQLGNAAYTSADVTDVERDRRQRDVAQREEQIAAKQRQGEQLEQLALEKQRKIADADNKYDRDKFSKPYEAERTRDAERLAAEKDYQAGSQKLKAQTDGELKDIAKRFASEGMRAFREQMHVQHQGELESDTLAAGMAGDTDKVRRLALEKQLEAEQFQASQRSKGEGDFFAQNIAPQKRLELELQINRERVKEAQDSQRKIADIEGSAQEGMLRASGRTYQADRQALERNINDKIKALRSEADAEQDTTRKRQLNAEADIEERTKQSRLAAYDLAEQRRRKAELNQIDSETQVANLQAQRRFYEASKKQITDHYDERIRLAKEAGKNEIAAGLEKERDAKLAVQESNRGREIGDIKDRAYYTGLRAANRPASAQLAEMEDDFKKRMEDANGDPEKQKAIQDERMAARREMQRKLIEDLQPKSLGRTNMRDFYFDLLGKSFENVGGVNPQFDRRRDELETLKKLGGAGDALDKAANKILNSPQILILKDQ